MSKNLLLPFVLVFGLAGLNAQAAEHYTIDTKGMHAFVTFKIKHLGYSWLQGRFNRFSGEFVYDETNPSANKVKVDIDIKSIDSNNAERDKHLRSERFFDTDKYPKAGFVSTAWEDKGNGKAILKGKFTLRGVTKDISIDVNQVGGGKDPWGGYRNGYEGVAQFNTSHFGMQYPKAASMDVYLTFVVEGIRE